MRVELIRSESYPAALKSGSCAIGRCEPCQVGNQAALSSKPDVPRGSLLGADRYEDHVEVKFDFKVYGLILQSVFIFDVG